MAKTDDTVQSWRERLTEIGESLPEVDASGDQHVWFKVRKKGFAYFWVDHHGDGRVALVYKAAPGVQQELVQAEPHRFYVPAYVGPKGWVALDLEAAPIDWSEIEEIMKAGYRLAAPKTLAQRVS